MVQDRPDNRGSNVVLMLSLFSVSEDTGKGLRISQTHIVGTTYRIHCNYSATWTGSILHTLDAETFMFSFVQAVDP